MGDSEPEKGLILCNLEKVQGEIVKKFTKILHMSLLESLKKVENNPKSRNIVSPTQGTK